MRRHPALPYTLPFGVFIALLTMNQVVPVPAWLRFFLSMAAILAVSRPALAGRPSRPLQSILLGVAIFVIWVGPDFLFPNWHLFFLFDNGLVGHPFSNTAPVVQNDPIFLVFRILTSVIAVPILEELFWRGWLMRYFIDSHQFQRVALGAFTPFAFWAVAALFASEHGSFWDVGLIAGILFNWWAIRTRNLWDCILAHAVTNGVLAAYVVLGAHWQYWL